MHIHTIDTYEDIKWYYLVQLTYYLDLFRICLLCVLKIILNVAVYYTDVVYSELWIERDKCTGMSF